MEKIHIKPFEAANQEEPCKDQRCRSIYEINSADILGLLDEQEYTWVHIWNPYCPDENCVNIGQFETLADTYKNKGLKLVYISATYDISKIFSIAENSSFSKPIYVLDGSYYGPKLKAMRQKLHMDLDKDAGEDDYFFQDDYLFKGDSLIYMGKEANDSIFEKLIIDKKQAVRL